MYSTDSVGCTDSEYGGVVTDVSELPVNTLFYVHNGAWYGKIFMHSDESVKYVACYDISKVVRGECVGKPHNICKLHPCGSDSNLLAISIIDPESYKKIGREQMPY